ncbi:unnamed protein product [Leuciscus chuanchicus]
MNVRGVRREEGRWNEGRSRTGERDRDLQARDISPLTDISHQAKRVCGSLTEMNRIRPTNRGQQARADVPLHRQGHSLLGRAEHAGQFTNSSTSPPKGPPSVALSPALPSLYGHTGSLHDEGDSGFPRHTLKALLLISHEARRQHLWTGSSR